MKASQAAERPDPDAGDRRDLVIGQPVRRRIHDESPVAEQIDTANRAHPDPSEWILEQAAHAGIGEAVLCGEVREATVLISGHATAVRAYPQRARAIDKQRLDVVALERGGIGGVEGGEPHAVEAHHTFMRRQPQVPIGRLADRADALTGRPS